MDKRKSTTALALGLITMILSLMVFIYNQFTRSVTGQEQSYVLAFSLLISGMIVALTGLFCGGAEKDVNALEDKQWVIKFKCKYWELYLYLDYW